MMASLASVNPYSGGAQPVRVNHYLIERELKNMPPCFLVVSNGEADLLA